MRALFVEFKKGYLGFCDPTAPRPLMTEVATDCSRYPSIGSEGTVTGCFGSGSLAGKLVTSYRNGCLHKQNMLCLEYVYSASLLYTLELHSLTA